MPEGKRNNGEFKIVSDAQGINPVYVRLISSGTRRNKAISCTDELREAMQHRLMEQLRKEYPEKFGITKQAI
jgi:hypothetical protein